MNVKDPVCGMTIERGSAAGPVEYQNRKYYFCSKSCQDRFEKDPASYADKNAASAAERGPAAQPAPHPEKKKPAAGSCPTCGRPLLAEEPHDHPLTEWTCPMHPEVR